MNEAAATVLGIERSDGMDAVRTFALGFAYNRSVLSACAGGEGISTSSTG
jgi:hypothetical protein